MFLRKIGKFLRGKATPFQITTATVLGALLGSLPGFSQGPLLMLLLLFLLIVINANIFLAGLALLLMRVVYLLLLPLYFHIGTWLLEGPLNGLVAVFVNAPVTAWFGFDYYVMVPSLAFGLLVGLGLGIGLSRTLAAFRRKMANLETGSERYQAYTSKGWVKALAWLLVGGLKGKKDWSEMAELKRGLPVRPLGIVFVLAICVLLFIGVRLLDETIVTANLRSALEQANGATVDLQSVEIQPSANRIVLTGLALADPEDLQTNRFAAREIIADVSGMNLLAKKVVVDSLQVLEPQAGTPRRVPGKRTVAMPEPEPVPESEKEEGVVSIDEYLGQAQKWRERLQLAKRVYDRIAPHLSKDKADSAPDAPGWREQLAERARELGYATLKSDSLIRKSPQLWIRQLEADNLEVGGDGHRFSISGTNLATQPVLLEESGSLTVSRADGNLEVVLGLPSKEAPARSELTVRYDNLLVEDLESEIARDLPMEGGTLDIAGSGTIDNAILNLPLKVTLQDTTLKAFGTTVPLDQLPIEVTVTGPLDRPNLKIPTDALEKAVKQGAQNTIEGLIQDQAGEKLKKLLPFGKGG